MRARALFLPWVIGAISAGIVGAAAWNLASEARIASERQETVSISVSEGGVPPLDIIPELVVIEPNNSEEHYEDAP